MIREVPRSILGMGKFFRFGQLTFLAPWLPCQGLSGIVITELPGCEEYSKTSCEVSSARPDDRFVVL